jgi:hypothetical protein
MFSGAYNVLAAPAPAPVLTPPPSWIITFTASLLLALLCRAIVRGAKNSGGVRYFFSIFELLSVAGAVAALVTTPLFGSIVNLGRNAGQQSGLTRTALGAMIVVLVAAYLYQSRRSFLWTLLFGIAVLILAGTVPAIGQLLTWWVNHPVAIVWNYSLAFFNNIGNLHVSK